MILEERESLGRQPRRGKRLRMKILNKTDVLHLQKFGGVTKLYGMSYLRKISQLETQSTYSILGSLKPKTPVGGSLRRSTIQSLDQQLKDYGLNQQFNFAGTIYETNAVAVASATRDGIPSIRMVLLKQYDHKGFVFFTNYDSRKGVELVSSLKSEE